MIARNEGTGFMVLVVSALRHVPKPGYGLAPRSHTFSSTGGSVSNIGVSTCFILKCNSLDLNEKAFKKETSRLGCSSRQILSYQENRVDLQALKTYRNELNWKKRQKDFQISPKLILKFKLVRALRIPLLHTFFTYRRFTKIQLNIFFFLS